MFWLLLQSTVHCGGGSMVGEHEASPPHCLGSREIKSRKWDQSMTAHSPPQGHTSSSQAPPPQGSVILAPTTRWEGWGKGSNTGAYRGHFTVNNKHQALLGGWAVLGFKE